MFRRFVAERQNDERIDQAYLGAGKAMMQQPRYLTSAYHYFLSALDLARSEQLAATDAHAASQDGRHHADNDGAGRQDQPGGERCVTK